MMAEKVMEGFLRQPVIRTYLFYVVILSLKMLLMSLLTGLQRFKNKGLHWVNREPNIQKRNYLKKVDIAPLSTHDFNSKAFINPEDAKALRLKVKASEDVERVRRAHRNDLENIPAFFIVCLVYLTTNPSAIFASSLIRVFTISRIIHTLVYAVVVIPQPARGITWWVGNVITIYMGVISVLHYWN